MKREQGKLCLIRQAWIMRFDLPYARPANEITTELMWQLCLCKDDSARRLILGVSEKSHEPLEQMIPLRGRRIRRYKVH